MRQDTLSQAGANHAPCRYGSSRLLFRGPQRPLDGRHVAFVGGSQTCGGLLARPFPALIEEELGEACVNFGQVNASVEAFLNDPLVGNACRDARLTVVEAMGAANLSNRLYSVHPRRNDRFLRASAALRAIYPEVDFAEICFTRHLLTALHEADPDRFAVVREELRLAWVARMRSFLERIGPRVLLLWFAPPGGEAGPLGRDPLFVTEAMVEALRALVWNIVVIVAPEAGGAEDPLGAAAHRVAAAALIGPLRAGLGEEAFRASA